MDIGVPYFPLLQLPNNALMNVLRNMEAMHKIGISLCSKRTKYLIKSLNMVTNYFRIEIKNNVTIVIALMDPWYISFSLFTEESTKWNRGHLSHPIKFPTPKSVEAVYEDVAEPYGDIYQWRVPGFGCRDWIDHLHTLFNFPIIDLCLERDSDIFDTDSLKETFHGLGSKRLHINSTGSENQLMEFITSTRRLFLHCDPFSGSNPESIQKILIQNFKWLRISIPIKLDDLFIINSWNLKLYKPGLSDNDLNRFIKLWMEGSNRRLHYLSMNIFPRIINANEVLSEVKHEIIPIVKKRTFESYCEDSEEPFTGFIYGGCDIQRIDGTKATIKIYSSSVEMIVWN